MTLGDVWTGKMPLAPIRTWPPSAIPAFLDSRVSRAEGSALGLQHRKQEALAAIQKASQSDPAQPHYLITQGRIYCGFGQPVEAITSFLKAAKLEPDSPGPALFPRNKFFSPCPAHPFTRLL